VVPYRPLAPVRAEAPTVLLDDEVIGSADRGATRQRGELLAKSDTLRDKFESRTEDREGNGSDR